MDEWETSKIQNVFLYITKVLLYKTVSSPFKASHLISQSKNAIMESHAQRNDCMGQISFFQTLLFRKLYGNIYDVIRALCMHQSSDLCHNIQNMNKVRMNDWVYIHAIRWSFVSFVSYPFSTTYIKYMLDFNNSSTYNQPPTKLTHLWSGYLTSVMDSFVHCILYYKVVKGLEKELVREDQNYKLKKVLIKYISMGITNIVTYPFDTIRKRQMITNQGFEESLDSITLNYGWMSLYDGLPMYLLKSLVSQLCIDGCDLVIDQWQRHLRKVKSRFISDTALQCRICYEREQNVAFKPCGHCICQFCKEKLQNEITLKCHICRAKITGFHKIYL
eukprot:49875_1